MADPTVSSVELCSLHQDHGDIRHDVANASADIRYGDANNAADIRRDILMTGSDIRREVAKEANEVQTRVLDGTYRNTIATDAAADRLLDNNNRQFEASSRNQFDLAREIANFQGANRAEHVAIMAGITGSTNELTLRTQLSTKDITIEGLKNTREVLERVEREGERTRDLIKEQKFNDLNRELIERNAALVELRHEKRHWKDGFNAQQFSALQSNLQAFQSQLQETRQGIINFGTLAGVGQNSTSNNVK